jgi:proteasome assembly chaperone (PAC2) family protein
MAPLYELLADPEVHRPVLVVGLEGWIDAGFGAAGALAHLLETTDTQPLARFDAEELVDHRSRRPVMHLVDGVNTGLTWPSIELRHGRDAGGRDLLVLVGAEPDVRWRAFAHDVVELAQRLGTELVLGLGAYPAPVPHTRAARLAVTATSAEWVDRIAEVRATLDVPAGAEAAIERRCAEVDLTAVGLWAQVPHYVMTMAYPAASALLLDSVAEASGLRIDSAPLHEAAGALRARLDSMVADNEEHVQMVRSLEAAVDAAATGPGESLPSGDQLAAEFQRFLRSVDRGEEEP